MWIRSVNPQARPENAQHVAELRLSRSRFHGGGFGVEPQRLVLSARHKHCTFASEICPVPVTKTLIASNAPFHDHLDTAKRLECPCAGHRRVPACFSASIFQILTCPGKRLAICLGDPVLGSPVEPGVDVTALVLWATGSGLSARTAQPFAFYMILNLCQTENQSPTGLSGTTDALH